MQSVGWYYQSILKLQRWLHHTFYNGCSYSSMWVSKWNHDIADSVQITIVSCYCFLSKFVHHMPNPMQSSKWRNRWSVFIYSWARSQPMRGEFTCVTSDPIVWDLTNPWRKRMDLNCMDTYISCNENYSYHIKWQMLLWLECIQGLYSLSGRTSYCKIS